MKFSNLLVEDKEEENKMTVRLAANAKCYGRTATTWYRTARTLMRQEQLLRELAGTRQAVPRLAELSLHEMLRWGIDLPTIIAIGGNSFEEEFVAPSVTNIAAFKNPIITHGNGPQVKRILQRNPGWKLFQAVVQSQKEIGGEIKELYEGVVGRRGRSIQVEVNLTRVIVSADDPAFKNPTKPIGDPVSFSELERMGVEDKGDGLYYVKDGDTYWREKSGAPGQYRQVVASPKPIGIHPDDLKEIIRIIAEGKAPIACGGGGAAIAMNTDGTYREMQAVIDKDLASALLANILGVREMVISTGVKKVTHFYGTPAEYSIDYYMLQDLLCNLVGGTIIRPDFSCFEETRADQIWEALVRNDYVRLGWGIGTVQPKAEEGLVSFKASLRQHTSPRVTDEDIELAHQMLQIAKRGQYPPGSMGEKLEAAVNALRGGAHVVLITHPESDWIEFEGTLITRGPDLSGRLLNAGRWAGNLVEARLGQRFGLPTNELQRWLVK